jgi:long-chain acyl-CoA synthetase
MKNNIGQLLKNRADNSPDVEAAVDLNRRITYFELNQQVNQLVSWLEKRGIKPKERIAILCQNSISMLTILYATAKLGAIALPLNNIFEMKDYNHILNESEPVILFYDEKFKDLAHQLGNRKSIHTMVQVGNGKANTTYIFPEMLAEETTDEPRMEAGGDDQFLLIYTSGTTGKPKGVMISHHNRG